MGLVSNQQLNIENMAIDDDQLLQEYLQSNVQQSLHPQVQTIPTPERPPSAHSNASSSSKQLLNRIANIRQDLNQMAESHNKTSQQTISPFRRHQSERAEVDTQLTINKIPSLLAEGRHFSVDQSFSL